MSLSPIFSINKDFLFALREDESEFAGPKLGDMFKDLETTFLASPAEELLFFSNDGVLALPFLAEDCDAADTDTRLAVDMSFEFDNLGIELFGVLVIRFGDSGFFFIFAALLSLFPVVTYTPQEKSKQ